MALPGTERAQIPPETLDQRDPTQVAVEKQTVCVLHGALHPGAWRPGMFESVGGPVCSSLL